MNSRKKRALIICTGWIGDTIACTAAATSLSKKGYQTTLLTRWPQLKELLQNDNRFNTKIYWHINFIKLLQPIFKLYFDLVVWEPKKWSYQEPFTCEIRRLSGCEPTPEYELFLQPKSPAMHLETPRIRPVIALARDIYKRSYDRDIEDLVTMLSQFADIHWVGLSPTLDSKKGKSGSIVSDAHVIENSDVFMGPEGGLLWIAAGLGKRCIYFTEHFLEVQKANHTNNLENILGSKNHFPGNTKYVSLAPFCTNDEAINMCKSLIGASYP